MKYLCYKLSDEVFYDVESRLSTEEKSELVRYVKEAILSFKFENLKERLLFEDGLIKGYLMSKIDLRA